MEWIALLSGGVITFSATYIILKRKYKLEKINNDELKKQKEVLELTINERSLIRDSLECDINLLNNKLEELAREKNDLSADIISGKYTIETLECEINNCKIQRDDIQSQIALLENSYANTKSTVETAIELNAEKLSKQCEEARELINQTYSNLQTEAVEEFQKQIDEKINQLFVLETQISDKQKIVEALIAESNRKAQEENQINFYRLNIPDEDFEEIEKLRDVLPYIRDKEVINKLIWTSYYRKPYQDLIARLFGDKKPCGIYKITSLIDSKVYIGQSTNIPNRLSEHIKRGLGAEPATKNVLYPTMMRQGVENFTFEMLEEVERDKLNEREKFYIEFYHSNEGQLNGTKGNG